MSKDPKAAVERLGTALANALGDDLVAFCLYGVAVRGDQPAHKRDVTTLLIVHDVAPAALRPMQQSVSEWTKQGHPPPLVFSERGWRASADVFPIEIEDMREAHLLVRGTSPFNGITTTKADLRRELEREVRGKLLRLRTEYVATAPHPKAMEHLLLDSIGTFFILFRAVLRLVGQSPPQERASLVRATAEAVRMDEDAFAWILSKLAGKEARSLDPFDPVGEQYLAQIERLANFVDSWREGVST